MTDAALCEILINSTDELALKEIFEGRIKIWKEWKADGSVKTGALDDMIRRLQPRHAYDYIPYAFNLLLEQEDETLFITALAMTKNFVKVSQVKEANPRILSSIEAVEVRMSQCLDEDAYELWQSILLWYGLT